MIHIWRLWKLFNFEDPHLPCTSTSNLLSSPTPLTLDGQFQTNLPRLSLSPSPNDNQSIRRKYNPRMTIICYKILLSGRLSCPAFLGLFFIKLKYHYLLFWGFIFFRVQFSKNITKCLSFIIIHILVLISQSTCFIWTTWKCKQTMEQQPNRAYERTKLKQKQNQRTSHSNWSHVVLFDLAHKQCRASLKDTFSLPSESKGIFLVNSILIAQHDAWSWRKPNFL